ncbi:MAG: hypothetical protein KIT87_08400 [Anaerolineae bacterium]|nr:hypothetical protein [Anaerolineae bacterium]
MNRFVVPGVAASLVGVAAAGLRVAPPPFSTVMSATPLETFPLPAGLPAPVERFYHITYGDHIPVIRTAILSGRGRLSLGPVAFPMRFRFIHEAARAFRSYFELTVFGQPVMKVNEHFVGGQFRQELPFGVEEGEPKIDHSAAIRMWSEWVTWLPAMLLTDGEARWEPVDDTMALLVVPYQGQQERLVVRFDPTTGKLQYVEGMKYKQARDTAKTLWVNAVWFGDRPWATFTVEDIVYNAAVSTSREVRGPSPTF